MFSPEQKLKIKEILKDFNHFYGYTDAERRLTGKSNPTSFFSSKLGDVDEDRVNGYFKSNHLTKVSTHLSANPN